MRHLITLSIATALSLAGRAQETRSSIHFASGSAALDAQAITTLDRLCGELEGPAPSAILIKGHTDNTGSDAYNRDLSQRRASAVRARLQATCPALAQATIQWKGESEPLADNAAEDGRAENRRVEIIVPLIGKSTTSERVVATRTIGEEATCHQHPRIERLLPGADKAREMHRADAAQPVDFTASDGTRVLIAANAMVDEEGKTVTGTVEISYRSFNEPYEIIASGIPMHVATEQGTEHMETAGMYEVYASQNGKPVRLKPGERIQLERPDDAAPDESYTGWKLDPATGAWVAGGTITRPASVALSATVTTGMVPTPATLTYWTELRRLDSEEQPDTTLFAARRSSGFYCHLTPCDTTTPRKVGWVQRRDRYGTVAGVPSIHVVGYKGQYGPENIVFAIRIKNDRQFPEWRRLPYDAAWMYIGPESKQMFKRLYGKQHAYQDIDLVMDTGNEQGTLRLKENGEWLDLRVSAALNRNTPARAERWEHAVKSYAKALAKRAMNFDRDVVHRKKRYLREHVNEHLQAWKTARRDMNMEEMAIASDAWREYALPRQPLRFTPLFLDQETQAALADVRTTFGLDDFGIYNIDRIMKMADQQQVIVATLDEEGKPFPWVAAYAVLKTERSVITYWGNGSGEGDNMLVSPGRMKSLFLVDGAGNVATAPTDPLNTGDPRAVLQVKRLDKSTDLNALRTTVSK